jgi:5-methylcytosine-specific restriction endonuclease McrA
MSSVYISKELYRRVAQDAGHRCGYCLSAEAVTGMPLTIEHLIPQSLGGPTEVGNLWLACWSCNLAKGARISALVDAQQEAGASQRPARLC